MIVEWPHEILSGQYWFRAHETGMGPVLNEIVDLASDSLITPRDRNHLEVTIGNRRFLTVRREPPCGYGASGPMITLRQLVRFDPLPPAPALNPLLVRDGRPLKVRYKEMLFHWRNEWRRLHPPKVPMWDVVDERARRVIGRLQGGTTRTTIFGADARPVAVMETLGTTRTFLVGGLPVAHIQWVPGSNPPDYRVDVAGAVAGGLDPRLVLACGIRDFAHLAHK